MNKYLGYYKVDNIEFLSKVQACIYGSQHRKKVEWVFNDDVFSRFDWTVEPEETLDQLYDRRARELREQYDYIIISYSAGADTHNLLTAFLRQNLHVDEILTNTMDGMEKYADISTYNFSAKHSLVTEHVLQTLPRLREIHDRYPNIKITVEDMTNYLFNWFENIGDASWVLNSREILNPMGVTRFNYMQLNKVRTLFDKNKKIALIMGLEKPRVFIQRDTGKVVLVFADRATNMASTQEHVVEHSNVTVEYFYWHPSCAKMISKQAHVIKKWLEAFPENQEKWTIPYVNPKLDYYRLLHEKVYRTLIYTTWDSSWFQANKGTSDWTNEWDSWFLETQRDTSAYRIWKEGLQYVQNNALTYLKYKEGKVDGLANFHKVYTIGNLKRNIIL